MIKKRIFRSVGIKVIFFYILLSFINLSFIISIIFESQIEIIGKNTVLESEKQVSQVIAALKKFTVEAFRGSLFNIKDDNDAVNQLVKVIDQNFSDYIIFSEKKRILYRSSERITLPVTYMEDGLRSMTVSAFSGKEYYLRVDKDKKEMDFYIPLNQFYNGDTILFIRKDIGSINRALVDLYKQAVYVIIVVIFFHVIFTGILYRLFIYPLNMLGAAAIKITAGDLNARVELSGKNYEFDTLADAFNNMAESVRDSITSLSDEMETVRSINRRRDRNATRDELTGMLNENYFDERVYEELRLAKDKKRGFSLMLIDVDDFGKINELYGKQTGDIVILETSRGITNQCGQGDIVARIGGEKFAVLSPESEEQSVRELALKIKSSIEGNRIVTPDGKISITVSIGASFNNYSKLSIIENVEEITKSAMSALSEAKSNGKNRVEFIS